MTNQEAFNKVYETFLVKRAPKSMAWLDGRYQCSYGEPGTPGCAVACLLTDEERIQAWDFERTYYAMPSYLRGNGTGVCELLGNTTITSLDNLSTDVLVSLQGWHDNLYGTPDERKELENIASFYGLVFPSA